MLLLLQWLLLLLLLLQWLLLLPLLLLQWPPLGGRQRGSKLLAQLWLPRILLLLLDCHWLRL